MKLWRIAGPGAAPQLVPLIVEGEPVVEVAIGEAGRGRSRVVVPIYGDGPEIRAKRTGDAVVLVRGSFPAESRCLVVVNPVGEYDRYRDYRLYCPDGSVEVLSSGTIAFGQAGRTNSGEEILAVVTAGTEFRLHSKYASHWYRWDGESWRLETPEARKARLALEAVQAGEGEWL